MWLRCVVEGCGVEGCWRDVCSFGSVVCPLGVCGWRDVGG